MRPRRRFRIGRVLLPLLALILIVGFSALGTWQLQRRAWKLALIEHVDQQLVRAPEAAPGRESWPQVDAAQVYLPVTVSGHFLHDRETLVQAMTRYGSGYWLMTPLQTDRNFTVLVNRGFVDAQHRDPATRQEAQREGAVEVAGLLRLSEPGGRLLQANDAAADRWYSRDLMAIAAARDLDRRELAPYFIDADSAPNAGGWPVGGLTVVHFRNMHLAYALSWFALALLSALGAWRMLREKPDQPAP